VVATQDNWEELVFDRIGDQSGNPLVQGVESLDSFGIGLVDGFVQELVLRFNPLGGEMHKKIAHKVQSSNTDRLHAQTGSPGACPDLRRDLDQFDVSHAWQR